MLQSENMRESRYHPNSVCYVNLRMYLVSAKFVRYIFMFSIYDIVCLPKAETFFMVLRMYLN